MDTRRLTSNRRAGDLAIVVIKDQTSELVWKDSVSAFHEKKKCYPMPRGFLFLFTRFQNFQGVLFLRRFLNFLNCSFENSTCFSKITYGLWPKWGEEGGGKLTFTNPISFGSIWSIGCRRQSKDLYRAFVWWKDFLIYFWVYSCTSCRVIMDGLLKFWRETNLLKKRRPRNSLELVHFLSFMSKGMQNYDFLMKNRRVRFQWKCVDIGDKHLACIG